MGGKPRPPRLKPCPFCGGPATFISRRALGVYSVGCGLKNNCSASPYVSADGLEAAVNRWNRRHG